MNQASEKRLLKVHPTLALYIARVAKKLLEQNIQIEVVQGLRTYAEQDALYAQGRTLPGQRVTNAKGGQSNHNFGLAVDVCPFINGQPDWHAPHAIWEAIGAAGKAEGLEWGGDWHSIIDLPHLQLPGLSIAECQALYAHAGLVGVWEKATSLLEAR